MTLVAEAWLLDAQFARKKWVGMLLIPLLR